MQALYQFLIITSDQLALHLISKNIVQSRFPIIILMKVSSQNTFPRSEKNLVSFSYINLNPKDVKEYKFDLLERSKKTLNRNKTSELGLINDSILNLNNNWYDDYQGAKSHNTESKTASCSRLKLVNFVLPQLTNISKLLIKRNRFLWNC